MAIQTLKRKKVDFSRFLSAMPARDYVFQDSRMKSRSGMQPVYEPYAGTVRFLLHQRRGISFSKRRSGKDCGGDSDRIPEGT